jgi:hypothetical protein
MLPKIGAVMEGARRNTPYTSGLQPEYAKTSYGVRKIGKGIFRDKH